ncbi:unnamed protein product, partial [marine sediment metagenome]
PISFPRKEDPGKPGFPPFALAVESGLNLQAQ